MTTTHERLWASVYAASFSDSEGLEDGKLHDIAERRAEEAVARWERRVARVAPVTAYQPTAVTTEPDLVEERPAARNGGTHPPPSMNQRHARG